MLANSDVSDGIPQKFEHLVKFCPFVLKIWSKKQIIESIMCSYSVANENEYKKFGLILSIRSQDIE